MSDGTRIIEPPVQNADEEKTPRRITVGSVIAVRSSASSWPAAVAIDLEATPVVGTSTLLRLAEGFARATVGWRADRDGDTTLRWTPRTNASPPPPMVEVQVELEPATPFVPLFAAKRVEKHGSRMPAVAIGAALLFFIFASVHSQGARSRGPMQGAAAHASPLSTSLPAQTAAAHSSPPSEAVIASAATRAAARTDVLTIDLDVVAAPPAPPSLPALSKPASSRPADLLTTAQDAFLHGQLERAHASYAAAVARSPRDVEAITGLGDVARKQGDTARALAAYAQALAIDPAFRPARIGHADALWDSGDHARSMAERRALLSDVTAPLR